jgi:uncharacterized protein (TIGR04255 family)
MEPFPTYPNSPITEAIIDLRVTFPKGGDVKVLDQPRDVLKAEYRDVDAMFAAQGEMVVGPLGNSASVRQHPIGWKLSTGDGKQIVQLRNDGFTYSRLAPYEAWRSFQRDASRAWESYRNTTLLFPIERLAVRYINRIDIPKDRIELKEYFRTFPEISPDLPQSLEGFFVQLLVPFPELTATCLINQTIVPPARVGVVSVVLDIDLFRTVDVPQTEESIWEYFECLRVEKDRIFEACITDSTRQLFQTCPS